MTYALLSLLMVFLSGHLAFAEPGAKKQHSKTRHAIHELTEAKTILTKITPDAEGHSVKAAQNIDAAIRELSQIKEAMPEETAKVS